MPVRKRKKYSRPRKPFDKARIEEENILVNKYGLKNKKEIWKADAAIARIRGLAKELITRPDNEKSEFVKRLQKKGFKVENIAEVLALNKEDWLKRRLQSVVLTKELANTPKQARQFIVHKHIFIQDQIVNIPSYQVSLEEEPKIRLRLVLNNIQKKKSKMEEIKDEIIKNNDMVVEQEAAEK